MGGLVRTALCRIILVLMITAVLLATACGSTDQQGVTAQGAASDTLDEASSSGEQVDSTETIEAGEEAEVGEADEAESSDETEVAADPARTEADTENTDEAGDYGPTPGAPTIDALVSAGRPLNLAHAGGDQSWPHSTMYAFSEAAKVGVDLLELDVRLSGDGVLIVHHDDTVDRTTEIAAEVGDLTLAELQALDNAYWFRPGCWACADNDSTDYPLRGVRTGEQEPPQGYGPDDFRIETFRSIATAFPDLALDIEIKGDLPGARATAEVLAAEILELDRTESTIVVSFDDDVIDVFRTLAPDVEVSPGLDRLTEWFLSGEPLEDGFRIVQVPPVSSGIEVITATTVDRAHDEGLIVWAWADDASTQENAAFYQRMLDLGVDGFITGRPELFPRPS